MKKTISIIVMIGLILITTDVHARYSGASNVQTYTGIAQGYNYNYTGRSTAAGDILKTYQQLRDGAENKKLDAQAMEDVEKILGAVSNTSGMLEDLKKNKYCDMDAALKALYGDQQEEMRKKYFLKDDGSTKNLAEVYGSLDAAMNNMINACHYETNSNGGAIEEITKHQEDIETKVKEQEKYDDPGEVIKDFIDGSVSVAKGGNTTIVNPITDQEKYNPKGLTGTDTTKIGTIIGNIVGAIQVVGSIIAVGALMIIGIRYMVASIDEKAKYKETMIPYMIGIILVFAIVNIVGILYNIFSTI